MNGIQYYRDKLNKLEARRDILKENLYSKKEELEYWTLRKNGIIEARKIFQELAKKTQQQLEFQISSIVSRAMHAIPFRDNYDFLVEFQTRRGKTECDLWFVRNGEKIKPVEDSGGGANDIAALALRLAFWSLKPTRPILILDEPLKFLSPGLHESASEMLKSFSDELGIQIIMVSHSETINNYADNVIKL